MLIEFIKSKHSSQLHKTYSAEDVSKAAPQPFLGAFTIQSTLGQKQVKQIKIRRPVGDKDLLLEVGIGSLP